MNFRKNIFIIFILTSIVPLIKGMEVNRLLLREKKQIKKLVDPLAIKAFSKIKEALFGGDLLDPSDENDLYDFFDEKETDIKKEFKKTIRRALTGKVNDSKVFERLTKKSSQKGTARRGRIAQAIGKDLLNIMFNFLQEDDWDHLIQDDADYDEYLDILSGLASSKLETLIKDPRASWQKLRDRSNVCWKTTYSVFKWASFSAISLLGAGGFLDLVTHHSVPGTASVLTSIVLLSLWCKHIK